MKKRPTTAALIRAPIPAPAPTFLAQGAHGCAFMPALTCTDPRINRQLPRAIGKVFADSYEAEREGTDATKISRIDPRATFTVPYYGECAAVVTPTIKGREKCDQIHDSPIGSRVPQLLYKFGGWELAELYERPEKHPGFLFDDILYKILPIFEGIQRLQRYGYSHTDIKPPNMLYDQGQVRLIDFGLMYKLDAVLGDSNMMSHTYQYYPIECLLINNYLQGLPPPSKVEAVRRFTEYPAANNVFYFLWKNHGALTHLNDLYQIPVKELIAKNNRDLSIAKGIDTYSLAISLLEIYCNVENSAIGNDDFVNDFVNYVLVPMANFNPYKRTKIDVAVKAALAALRRHPRATALAQAGGQAQAQAQAHAKYANKTVADLKRYLKQRMLPVTGNKATLIARLLAKRQ